MPDCDELCWTCRHKLKTWHCTGIHDFLVICAAQGGAIGRLRKQCASYWERKDKEERDEDEP